MLFARCLTAVFIVACIFHVHCTRVSISEHLAKERHFKHASHDGANSTVGRLVPRYISPDANEKVIEFSARRDQPAMKNKLAYVLLALLSACGCDRCYMGYAELGCLKGCGVACSPCLSNLGQYDYSSRWLLFLPLIVFMWVLLDFWVAVFNAMTMQESIKTLGYNVHFEEDGIESAWYVAFFVGVLPVFLPCLCLCCCNFLIMSLASSDKPLTVRERVKLARQKTGELRDDVVTRFPKPLTKALRQTRQLCKKPSEAEISNLFDRSDANHDGTLDFDEFKAALAEIGVDEEEAKEIGESIGLKVGGKLSRSEFVATLCAPRDQKAEESNVEEPDVEEKPNVEEFGHEEPKK